MRSLGGWVLLIVGGLLAAALLAAGLLAFFVSRIDVRAEVERAVESASGRDLTIAGDVGVSFWPVLGLRARDATLSNVEGGRAPAFVTADEIDIGVELRPLLDRQIVVRRLVFRAPRIALEVSAEGRPNWLLAPRRPAPAPGPAPAPTPAPAPRPPAEPPVDVAQTSLREIRIVDGAVSFYDARRGGGWVVGQANLTSALSGGDEPMHIEGDVVFNDRPMQVDAVIARPRVAARGGLSAVTLKLESELLTVDLDGQTTAMSAELAGLMHASGPSLRQLAAWAGAPLIGGVGMEAFAVSGRIAIGGGQYAFSNAEVSIDQIHGRGDFALRFAQAGRPYLSGRLQLSDVDLNPYLTGQAPPPSAPAGQSQPAITAPPPAPRIIDVSSDANEAPLDFSTLRVFNADLELVTGPVLVQHMRLDRARVGAVINDGYLVATVHEIGLYGGAGRGRFEIDARELSARTLQEFTLEGLDAQPFLADAFNYGGIEGRAAVSLNVRTQGRTQREMAAGLDGRAQFTVTSGVLHGVDLGGVATTIRNALRGELIAPEARTPFQNFSATFAIADGVLATDDLNFTTADLRIPGIGVFDTPQQRLDLRLAARSPRGGIAVPFSVRGPWTRPSYTADISGAALRDIQPRVRAVQAAAGQ